MINILKDKEYLRSILFGIEDSLIATTGLIAGISVGSNNKQFVILAAIIAISIEAVSMGAGEYLSDYAVIDLNKIKPNKNHSLLSSLLMIISYVGAGMVPLFPTLFVSYPTSLFLSIGFAFIAFFLLGFIKGKLLQTSSVKEGLKILGVGGLATILGLVMGLLFRLNYV